MCVSAKIFFLVAKNLVSFRPILLKKIILSPFFSPFGVGPLFLVMLLGNTIKHQLSTHNPTQPLERGISLRV